MLRDLWVDRSRTVLVVLSIAVGVFALSLTMRTEAILSRNMLAAYAAITPANVTITAAPFDQQIVAAVQRVPGVRAAQGLAHLDARVRIGAQWRPIILNAIPNFQNMTANRLAPAGGAWPPPRHTLLLERSYLEVAGVELNAPLLIETPAGRQFQVPVAGLAHDLTSVSGRIGSPFVFAYVTPGTAEWLGLTRDMNTLQIVIDADPSDATAMRQIVDRLHARLEAAGHPALSTSVQAAPRPELYDIITSILQTLRALGEISLALSAFLIVNTINGLLVRQIPQIGVLKAIGAPRRTIITMYLAGVLVLGIAALLVAVPLGALGAQALAAALGYLFNYDITNFSVPPYISAIELTASLIVPLLVAFYPILAGTRVTVREAIDGRISSHFGRARVDRLVSRLRTAPLAQLYAIRNLLRRKGRLALTLVALSLGGAIAIAVLSVRASLFTTLDQVADYWRQDITLTLDQPGRADEIMHQIAQTPGVVRVENQPGRIGVRQRADGSDAERLSAIFGVQPGSELLRPTVIQGRWLRPHDADAVVVNVAFLKHEPDVRLGDTITLKVNDRKTRWSIVGVVTSQLLPYRASAPDQGVIYANLDAFGQSLLMTGDTDRILIVTARHDPAFQQQVASAIEARLARPGVQIITQTRAAVQAQVTGLISALLLLLLAMVALFLLVAGLSLMGAMSLNVLDRTKEIGVLRAIGSSSANVLWIVLAEGIYVGIFSWLLATLIAVPLSKIISDTIGWNVLSWPLVYSFPPIAPLSWLAIVVIVAACASYVPAATAARLSVREILAYEG